jgi:repressor LexA
VTTRERVLEYLHQHSAEHGWMPTVREIMAGVGLASPSTVELHLASLERDGLIERGHGARTIRFPAERW